MESARQPGPTLVRTGDMDQVHRIFKAAHIDWAQLEHGRYEGTLVFVELGAMRVFREGFNVGLQRRGDLERGVSLVGVLADSQTRARWFGVDATDEDMAFTPCPVDVNTLGTGAFYVVTLEIEHLLANSENPRMVEEFGKALREVRLLRNPDGVRCLRAYVRSIFDLAERFPDALSRPGMRRIVERDLLPLLVSAVDGDIVNLRKSSRRQIDAVRACEKYMLEHIDEPITLQQLTEISGLGARSLFNAFEAVIGLPPLVYLKRQRLSGVRRTLRRANHWPPRIIDIALDWGFTHMSHFADDYRRMFGERPSQTLHRA
jgi:AraC family transcriptional regulator, ethanolamine operon transcriptional activator